ncbi:MAG: helix-turn-helix domain-containing protein [Eubacteriales bacterium]|jgi:transcriptional regulator with XRE-family HTH domain
MNENELRQNISRNIILLRRRYDMTQAELAEKLSYSDKSVSKWERQEGLPDIYVLVRMAELFGVTVNYLISEPKPEPLPTEESGKQHHFLIAALSVGLVWFVATLLFCLLKVCLPESEWLWMTFVYAVPVSAIVAVVFAHLWWGLLVQGISVSALVWGVTVCIHITALVPDVKNMALIYAAAGVFQVLVVLWYLYLATKRKRAKMRGEQEEADEAQGEARPSGDER